MLNFAKSFSASTVGDEVDVHEEESEEENDYLPVNIENSLDIEDSQMGITHEVLKEWEGCVNPRCPVTEDSANCEMSGNGIYTSLDREIMGYTAHASANKDILQTGVAGQDAPLLSPDGDCHSLLVMSPDVNQVEPLSGGFFDGSRSVSCSGVDICLSDSDDSLDFVDVTPNVIDVAEMSKLVESGQSNIRSLEGKDVVLLLGKTGVGKSTFIQMINGAKIQKKKSGQCAYVAVEDEYYLPNFAIGYDRKSKTKTVRSYEHTASGLIFCDMPGYKDTDSYHIDIATAVWINDIARVSRSLRFLVLIHGSTLEEDRGGGFRDLMGLLTKLMKNDPLKVVESLMVCFTHMSDRFTTGNDETILLPAIEKEIKEISKAKDHKKNVLMKFIRSSIMLKKGNVRVLNPVSTDITSVLDYLSKSTIPLDNAQDFVQCSLSREVELVVSFAMGKLETAIQHALHTCDLEIQKNLLELLKLLLAFAAMLKSEKYYSSLHKSGKEVWEEYKLCRESLLLVVDSTVSSETGRRLGRGDVERAVSEFKKLKLLSQVLTELNLCLEDEESAGFSVADVENIRLEFHRKCLLLKIDILGLIRTCVDYATVFQQLENLQSLDILNDCMGEFYEMLYPATSGELSQVVGIPDISQQFVCLVDSVLVRVSCRGGVPQEAFLADCLQQIKSEGVQSFYILYLQCYELLVQLLTTNDSFAVISPKNMKVVLRSIESDLTGCVHNAVFSVAAVLRCEDLREKLREHVMTLRADLVTALSQATILTKDDMTLFLENIRRVQSYDLHTAAHTAHAAESVDFMAHLDEVLVTFLGDLFSMLQPRLFMSNHQVSFFPLANKAQLLRYHPSFEVLLPSSWACLTKLLCVVQNSATELLGFIKKLVDNALYEKRYEDIQPLLENLSSGEEQLAGLLPDFDSVQRIHWDLQSQVRSVVENLSSGVLHHVVASAPLSEFSSLMEVNDVIGDVELKECLQMDEVIDQYGYHSRLWDGQLLFSQGVLQLGPLLRDIRGVIEEKRSECFSGRISVDESLIMQVQSLCGLVWVDIQPSKQGTQFPNVTATLGIVKEHCLWRFQGLTHEISTAVAADPPNHILVLCALEEFQQLQTLCIVLSLALDMTPVLEQVKSLLHEFSSSVRAACEEVAELHSEAFPFSLTHEFMTLKDRYKSLVTTFNLGAEFMSNLTSTETAVARCLQRVVVAPLSRQTPVLELDPCVLREILSWEFRMHDQSKSLLPFVSVLTHYSIDETGRDMSLRASLKMSLVKLITTIQELFSQDNDFEQLSASINLLERFTPLGDFVQENLSGQCTFFRGQQLALQSRVQEDCKEQIGSLDLTGMRVRLDACNVRENSLLYNRYTALMELLGGVLKQFLKGVLENTRDGAIIADRFAKLNHVWTQIGGCDGNYDHIKEFLGVDVEDEVAGLKKSVRDHFSDLLHDTDEYSDQQFETAIKAAQSLWTYHGHVKAYMKGSKLQCKLDVFTKKVALYFHWDTAKEPKQGSLAFQVCGLVYAFSAQKSRGEGDGAINILALTNVLDQLQHLQGVVTHPILRSAVDYSFWSRQVLHRFNDMFDQITTGALNNYTFATSLNILKLASFNFSGGFMQHMNGDGFDLARRFAAMEAQLEQYNQKRDSAFETNEGCAGIKKSLDHLKFNRKNESGYTVRWIWRSVRASSTPACGDYSRVVYTHQSRVDVLFGDLTRALKDGNLDLVQSRLTALSNANRTLHMHLKVPLGKVDQVVITQSKLMLRSLMAALNARDVVLFSQRFAEFYFLRKLMVKNELAMDKESVDEVTEMHKALAAIIDNTRAEFEDMCAHFNFKDALNLVDLIRSCRMFIDSASTRDYCKSFEEVSIFDSFISMNVTAFYRRMTSKRTDSELCALNNTMLHFPELTEISNKIQNLHPRILEQVKESVSNHEYFKLKGIAENLTSFHLLNDLVGGKDMIDGTKKSVDDMIKGSLEALRQDVTLQWTNRAWAELNDSIKVLQEAEQELKHFSGVMNTSLIHDMQQELENRIGAIGDQAINIATGTTGDQIERIRDFAIKLADLGRVYDQVQLFYTITKIHIRRVLNHCQEQCGLNFIFRLGLILEEGSVFGDEAGDVSLGHRLVMDFHHFKDVATLAWSKQVAHLPVNETLGRMKSYTYNPSTKKRSDNQFDRLVLERMYKQYKDSYDQLVVQYLPEGSDITEIVAEVLKIGAAVQPCTLANWNDETKRKLPDLLAGIFAYYTVNKSGDSFNSIDFGVDEGTLTATEAEDILFTPHNIQVLTVLRLLGCADAPTSLQNHLMEIGTGEGKSIVLGALATIFGILGFSVRCVCYSEYLSSRDYGDFEDTFEAFGCKQRIVYSKITSFAEDSIARRGNIRELTREMILGTAGTAQNCGFGESKCDELEEVLLVDEVDVFFGKDFYGQTYNQVTHISTPEVTALIKKIWTERLSKPSLRGLSSTEEYQKLMAAFPLWKFLIDNELKLMCSQVNSFDQPKYYYNSQTDKVGYSEHDTISYSLSYGYRTLFAYMRELDKGNVKAAHQSMFEQSHLHMHVSCGQFSYANINPGCIIGVSGTLTALTEYEQDVMARYNIRMYSLAPSVYGQKELVFDELDSGVTIAEDKANYFKAIVNDCNSISRYSDASRKKRRAVIVFFESCERMDEFRRSEFFRQVIENTTVNMLSEKTPNEARDYIVKKASTCGQVTLATKVFGRGTDFTSRDSKLNDCGGTHIVQAFLSEMVAGQIQIQGRTSRQGQKGSYSLVLLVEDNLVEGEDQQLVPRKDTLMHFGIDQSGLSSQSRANRYQYLCQKRAEKRLMESVLTEESLVVASERDRLTQSYFSALLAHQENLSRDLFEQIYMAFKGTVGSRQAGLHVVFMLDESGSMAGAKFAELQQAYDDFVCQRLQREGADRDVMTVINFNDGARTLASMVPFLSAPTLSFSGGGTSFCPPLNKAAAKLQRANAGEDYVPILILMTDGSCSDIGQAVEVMSDINNNWREDSLQAHFVAFGDSANIQNLMLLQNACSDGHIHTAAMGDLSVTFKDIEQSLVIAEYH